MRKTLIITTGLLALALPLNSHAEQTETSVQAEVIVGSQTSSGSSAPAQTERVSVRTYEVVAKGNRRDSRSDVREEALYLAARKTLDNNYDWFRVTETYTDRDRVRSRSSARVTGGFERRPVKSCGLLGCTTRYETNYRAGYDNDWPERDETVYEVTLEFEMGTGRVSNPDGVHDARIVKRSYR